MAKSDALMIYNEFTLTTIICCHNEQDYLENCVASLALDAHPDWEVFIVDDASRDNTFPIIKKLAKQHPSLRYSRFDVNMGPGVARNFGLLQAKGRYVHFLDADDTVVESALAKVVAVHDIHDASIIQCPHYRLLPGEEKRVNPSAVGEFSGEEAFRRFITGQFGALSACTGVYRREFLLESGCRFQQGGFYEDVIFGCHAMYRSAKVLGYATPFYVYNCTNPSITRGAGALSLTHTLSSARLYHEVCEFFALLPDAERYEKEFIAFSEQMTIEHAPRMARSLQGAEFAASKEKQKKLRHYLSLRPSVFTEAIQGYTCGNNKKNHDTMGAQCLRFQ